MRQLLNTLWDDGPNLTPEMRKEFDVERVMRLNRNQLFGGVAFCINPIAVCIGLWQDQLALILLPWCLIGQLFAYVQIYGWWRNRSRPRPTSVSGRIFKKAAVLASLAGVYWGAIIALCVPLVTPQESVAVVLTSFGTSIVAAALMNPAPAAAFLFFIVTMLPGLVMLSWQYPEIALALNCLAVPYIAFVWMMIIIGHRDFRFLIAKQVENRQLALESSNASDAKSRFIANMSHELRTPLNAIIGFADMMQAETFGPVGHRKYVEYVGAISESGNHLMAIINDVLDISRIDAGSEEIRESDVAVGTLLGRCKLLFAERAARSGIHFSTESAFEHLVVHVDERLTIQILINLLSNAMQHTPDGGTVSLTVSLRPRDGVMFTIRDNGRGMTPEQLARAREPFGSIGNSWVSRGDGAGLGLPISHRFASLHGGQLEVDSEFGNGTKCILRIPISRVRATVEDHDLNALMAAG
ncbi:MAG: HAMP domain-containing sensor histidine kinase [Minwuia sp.]|nr:HAMP domain-containing sensor histidine kinase [Minwuia sp.]